MTRTTVVVAWCLVSTWTACSGPDPHGPHSPSAGGGGAEQASGGGGMLTTGGTPGGGGFPSGGGSPDGASGGTWPSSGGHTPHMDHEFIGNIVHKNKDIPEDFADHWMQVTMEANAKWGFVQPDSPDQWIWEPVDAVYNYAKEHGIVYKQHNFFWSFEQPIWVNNANVAAAAENWVRTFCERYPDVAMIDVVNEPLAHAPPYKEGLGGDGASGYDWIVNAFNLAKKHCPNATLLINDYSIIEWQQDHDAFVELLHKVLAAGAPIDALGVQGHDVYRVGVDQAKGFIDDFSRKFALPIYITEFDIDIADDAQQKAVMEQAITMFWNHPNVRGVTYWGYQYGLTWAGSAYLVRADGTARPAMTWLQDFVASHR